MSQNYRMQSIFYTYIFCKEIVGSCLQDRKERRCRNGISGMLFKMFQYY